MSKIILSGFSLLLVLAVLGYFFLANKKISSNPHPYLEISGRRVNLEIAQTPWERTKGLSGHPPLAADKGMLFIFPQPNKSSFWMQGMKFNLDFIFFNQNTIVDLIAEVPFPQPGQLPRFVNSSRLFTSVLEVNSGTIEKLNLKIGDQVQFHL